MISSCESLNNNIGLRLGVISSQVYWLECFDTNKRNHAISFPRNTKYLIEYML